VIGVGDLDEEVSVAAAAARLVAALDRLDQHAGGVGRDAERVAQRVLAHRLDDGRADGAPTSSFQRHIVARSSGVPMRAARSSCRWNGRPSHHFSVRRCASNDGVASDRAGSSRGGGVVTIIGSSSPSAPVSRYFARATISRTKLARRHISVQLSSQPIRSALPSNDGIGQLDALLGEVGSRGGRAGRSAWSPRAASACRRRSRRAARRAAARPAAG
jgi:hypothetical protein